MRTREPIHSRSLPRTSVGAQEEAPPFPPAPSTLSDLEIVQRIRAGDVALFEILLRRYNRRLFRAARSILRDEAEAEDAVQEAWIRAYKHLERFAGRSSFAAWVTRIAAYVAYTRLERRRRSRALFVQPGQDLPNGVTAELSTAPSSDHECSSLDPGEAWPAAHPTADLEREVSQRELREALERAIDRLPVEFRTVFVLREVEGMTIAETATALDLLPQTVKTRLHRARRLLRKDLAHALRSELGALFDWGGERCDRVVRQVFALLRCSGRCALPKDRPV